MANLAPTWRPKRLPNRGQNLKKSMLKSSTFFTSIFSSFVPRFGEVFGRFFGAKSHAKSDEKKIVRQPIRTVKTNTDCMSALWRQAPSRAKIHEKMYVFWDFDFGSILGGFGEGLGRPKSSIFAFFSAKKGSDL